MTGGFPCSRVVSGLLAGAFLLLQPVQGGTAEGSLRVSGSIKTYLSHIGASPLIEGGDGWMWDTPLRLRLFAQPRASISLEVVESLSLASVSGPTAASPLGPMTPSTFRIADPHRVFSGDPQGEGTSLLKDLDRLNLSLHLGKVDLTVGRQVVSFGSAHAVNPTDVLAPFDPRTPDKEDRSGVDALRLRWAWSDLGECDLGYVAGDKARWGSSAAYLKPKVHLGGLDLAPLAMVYAEKTLLGLDLQRPLGGAGTWLEAAWTDPHGPEKPYVRLSAGCDYNLTATFYGFVEYHFNGAGSRQPSRYLFPEHPSAYREGTVVLLGRHELVPSLVYQATPLLSLQAEVFFNLGDGSLCPVLQGEYNLARNLYLDLGASFPIGSGPEGLLPTSEWGLAPSYQYLFTRFYF